MLQPHLWPHSPKHTSTQLDSILSNFHPLSSPYSCHSSSTPVVNNSNEVGPVEELALLANETSVTLFNLKYSTRYKFYLNAKTVRGAGPAISQEVVPIINEGKSENIDDSKKISSKGKLSENLIWLISVFCNLGKKIKMWY